MSGNNPEQSLAYPAHNLCFEVPSALFKTVLTATKQTGLREPGEPTDWIELHNTGPGGQVIEFRGSCVLPEVDPPLIPSPFRHGQLFSRSQDAMIGDFRTRWRDGNWVYDNDMVVGAHTVWKRRGRVGRAVFLTVWSASRQEPSPVLDQSDEDPTNP